jgi:hypothetical protein
VAHKLQVLSLIFSICFKHSIRRDHAENGNPANAQIMSCR